MQDDYLQSLRLYFCEQLELCRNGEITPNQLVGRVRNRKPEPDDISWSKIKSVSDSTTLSKIKPGEPVLEDTLWQREGSIVLTDLDEISSGSNTQKAIEKEYRDTVIKKVMKKLTDDEQKIINMRYGLYDEPPVSRHDEMELDEISERLKHGRKATRTFLEKTKRKVRGILEEHPDVKNSLLDTI